MPDTARLKDDVIEAARRMLAVADTRGWMTTSDASAFALRDAIAALDTQEKEGRS